MYTAPPRLGHSCSWEGREYDAPPQEQDYIGLAEISSPHKSSSDKLVGGNGTNFRETELRLRLSGSESPARKEKVGLNLCRQPPKNFAFGAKSGFSDAIDGNGKAQVVGWPPIRSYRKNSMAINPSKNKEDAIGGCLFVKVIMDGAPYLCINSAKAVHPNSLTDSGTTLQNS
ncbi:Auxin-responsive protein IAA8 [Platanthera guangdongensis]|uniref:Auxin-responsive protein n=1 Tax=Platanthera guangdongensis TaxID=2320717 RepID=A0ABR2LLZ0_9ASPA